MKNLSLSSEAKTIRKNGWKQGSLFKIDENISQSRNNILQGTYLVISQDCDIQTHPLSIEPYVEIILCKKIKELEGSLTKGKNPRKFHFSVIENDNIQQHLEIEINNRFFIDRQYLLTNTLAQVTFTNVKCIEYIIDWITKRYRRDAFPDNFNNRLDRPALKKTLEKHHNDIEYICVRLHTEEELPDNEPYKILLIILIDEISMIEREELEKILDKLTKQCEKDNNIKVISAELRSFDEINLSEFIKLKQLDFDYLSSF